ncbi:MAG: hypothetical protein ACTHJR_12450 [Sphingomonas sp.]|uniref:hypothetical protein n=1 Tax=Sphingomonas sp. TaxID=28214 RepID=UPI003F819E4A
MKARLVWALAASLAVSHPVAVQARKMFPPGPAASVWWDDLIDDEPVLWRAGGLDGFKSRFRLSIAGIALQRVLIRIDQKANGEGVGRIAIVRRAGRGRDLVADVDRTFLVAARDMAALHEAIVVAKLWTTGPEEHWVVKDDICLDGEQLIFERADADGYRFSEANAQCTAPPAVLAVARQMIDLSGERRPLALLR